MFSSATNACSGSVKPEAHQEICANSVAHSQLCNEVRLGLIMQPLPWMSLARGDSCASCSLVQSNNLICLVQLPETKRQGGVCFQGSGDTRVNAGYVGLKVLYRAGLEKSSNHQTVLRRRWSCWSLVASHSLLLYSMMIITATIQGLTEHNDIIRLPLPCLSMWKDRGISAKSFDIMLKNSFIHEVGMCFLPLSSPRMTRRLR
jgi:hypothetical protein